MRAQTDRSVGQPTPLRKAPPSPATARQGPNHTRAALFSPNAATGLIGPLLGLRAPGGRTLAPMFVKC